MELITRIEGTIAIGALFVLLSAMWDERISAAIAVVALGAPGIYPLTQREHQGAFVPAPVQQTEKGKPRAGLPCYARGKSRLSSASPR